MTASRWFIGWLLMALLLFSQCSLLKRKTPYQKEMSLAQKLYTGKKYTESLEHYTKALNFKPNDVKALLGLAKTHIALNNIPAARSTLEQVLTQKPSSHEAQEANSLLQTLPAEKLPPKKSAKKLRNLLEARKLEGVNIPKVTPETEAMASSFYQRGLAQLKRGHIDFAIGLLQKAEELNEAFPGTYVALGVAYMKKGMFNQATAQLRQAIRLDPLNVEARYNLGLIYEGKGLWELARNEYMQLLPLNINNPLIYTRLGLVYMEMGLPSAAVDAWRIASSIDPQFLPPRLLLAKAYADVGPAFFVPITYSLNYDSSTHTLDITRSTSAGKSSTLTFFDAAIGEYREVLHLNPHSAEAHYGLGSALARAEQSLVPVYYFDGQDHRDPYNGRLKAKMSPQEMLDASIQQLAAATRLDPKNAVYRTNLGVVYAEAGKYKKALHEIKAAIALDKDLLAARGVLGVLLSYIGKLQSSTAEYKRIGRVHPDLVRAIEALNALQKVTLPTTPMLPAQGAVQKNTLPSPSVTTPPSSSLPTILAPGAAPAGTP